MVERGGACVGEGVEKKEPENVSNQIIKTVGLTKAIQTDEADEGGASSLSSSLTLSNKQHEKKVVSSSSNTAATVSSSSCASASKLLKIDFKLINHRLKDIGLDSWTVKRFVTLVRNNFLEQQDLINEMTINKLRKLLNEHTILRFLDYLETDTLFKSRTINQLMLKSDPNTLNCCNKMVFWINKWENNDPNEYFQHHQTVEQQTSSQIGGGGAASGQVLATANNLTDSNGCGQCSNDPLMLKHSKRIVNFMTPNAMQHRPGPNMTKVMEILEKNDYILELSNGQRKYAKPSPNPDSPVQSSMMTTTTRTESVPNNTEIFVGKIPKDMFEDELIPLFESIGPICNLRLMMDPFTGSSRGYAFITYFQPEHARSAVEQFDNYELLNYGTHLKVKMSIPNVRLFIGNISKDMTKEDIRYEFQKHATGLVDVIVYHSPHDRKRNRGFCFLEFETHKHASQAKRKFLWHHLKIWDSEIWVDWAEPLEQPNDEIMSKVKVLYVRNLLLEMNDQHIKELFAKFGSIERVKKIKDYAFVHFEQRVCALEAMKQMNGHRLVPDGLELEISLAKPPTDKKRKEEILRNREKRLMNMMMHSRFTNAIVCSNNNNNPVQGITFVPQQTSSLSATSVAAQQPPPQPLPPSSTSLVIDSLMTTTGPMFINPAGNGTLGTANNVSGTSAYALPAAVPGGCIPGNYYLGYATSHQPQQQQQHHHFPMYHQHHHHHHHQLLPRSAVARVTLASNNDEILTSTNQQHLNHPSMTSMVNGSSSKSETRLYNDSDPITGFEIINDHHSKSDLDLYNRNYGHFEDCAWCSVATNAAVAAAAATVPTVQPSPQQSSNLFAIIPAMDPNPSISLSVPHHHQQQQQPQMQQSNVQDGQISSTTTIATTINPMIPGDVDNQTKCNNN